MSTVTPEVPLLDNETIDGQRKTSVPDSPYLQSEVQTATPAIQHMSEVTEKDQYYNQSVPIAGQMGGPPVLMDGSYQYQEGLMHSFNPYMFQPQFADNSSAGLAIHQQFAPDGSNPLSIPMLDPAGTVQFYDMGSRTATPYFESFDIPASISTTPMGSPMLQHQVMSTPPGSPQLTAEEKRKHRFKATEAELPILSAVFEKNPFPSAVLRKKLADKLNLDPKQIQFWFQNRRATLKVNGIHVVKPKKSNTPSASFKPKPQLAPLTAGNPYFFVEQQDSNNAAHTNS